MFTPTCTFGTRRALLAVAATKDFEINQVDIKTALLNRELEEEVYLLGRQGLIMEIPVWSVGFKMIFTV